MEFEQIFNWESENLAPVLGIGASTLAFIAYYFVMISDKVGARVGKGHSEEAAQARWIIAQRIWGGLVMGITALLVPLFLGISPAEWGMSFSMNGQSLLLALGIGVLVVLLNLGRAGQPANLEQYPQIRSREWDLSLLLWSSLGWVIYLLGYELMFRGLLLYSCIDTMGIWPAIAINCAIYSFAHFFKGIGETVGAIPFGIIVCVLTLWTGNFMLAFLIHCSLALSNQTVAFFQHPDMKLARK